MLYDCKSIATTYRTLKQEAEEKKRFKPKQSNKNKTKQNQIKRKPKYAPHKQQTIARNRIVSNRNQIDIFIRRVYFSVTYDVAL